MYDKENEEMTTQQRTHPLYGVLDVLAHGDTLEVGIPVELDAMYQYMVQEENRLYEWRLDGAVIVGDRAPGYVQGAAQDRLNELRNQWYRAVDTYMTTGRYIEPPRVDPPRRKGWTTPEPVKSSAGVQRKSVRYRKN